MSRMAIMFLGYGCLFLGVIGMVVPLLQGALLIVVGLILLSRTANWAQSLIDRLKDKYPKISASINKAEKLAERLEARFGRKL